MKALDSIKNLKEKDLYSIILYAIYKCTNNPEYATISELIYTLDKDSLLNLCSIYGGCTVRIPTMHELKMFVNGLLVYQLMDQGNTFSVAYRETGLDPIYRAEVAKAYKIVSEVLAGYDKQD